MANLDYFRRPTLAGNTLVRTQTATLRGSVRRNDADGFSTVPYFPSLSGKTLQIKIEGTTYSVSFTSDSFSNALTAINAVIDGHPIGVANGDASDSDGSISIRSTSVSGGGSPLRATGSVEIVGGTATAILGFDIAYHALKAYGGETLGAPEGRLKNPFRTSFLNRGETLSANSVNRGLAAVAANTDVLLNHHRQEDAVLQKVNVFTNNGFYLTVGAGISVPIGLGLLSGSSNKEDLSPFFQIIDQQTKQPHASRVVGVVKGPPGAVYPTGWPYANQTVWTDNLGRNLLNQQIEKTPGGGAITAIVEGKYVVCSGTPFTQVAVGDFAEVYGATNTDHLDNNGFKWVVEEVLSSSVLALRPMSKRELSLVGYTPTSVQPSVELSGTKQPAQSFGAVMVKTGAFATVPASQPDSLNLVVFPEIPIGAPIDLWMAQPKSLVDVNPYDVQQSAGYGLRQLASDYDPSPNGLLSSPTLGSSGGTTLSVGSFYVRWHGRVIRVGAQTVNVPANPVAVSIVYWDSDSNSVKVYIASTSPPTGIPTTLFSGPANPDPTLGGVGFQIAEMISISGVSSVVAPTSKLVNGEKCSVTVGHGGDFNSIAEATAFLLMMNFVTTESDTSNGAYSHFEIVLLSDQTLTTTVNVQLPSLTIRGAAKSIRLITNVTLGTNAFYCSGSLTLENLTVKALTGEPTLVERDSSSVASKILIRNVIQDTTGLAILKIVKSGYSGVDVLIEDCQFPEVCLYVVDGTTSGNINISRSHIGYQFLAPYVAPMFIACDALTLRISESSFPGWKGGGAGVVVSTLASPSLTDISLRDSKFDFGAQTDTASWFMRVGAARCVVSGCYINMTNNSGINSESGSNTSFSNCTITTNSIHASLPAFGCRSFLNNKVTTATGVNNLLLDNSGIVSGNDFSGEMTYVYVRSQIGGRVVGNKFVPSNLGSLSFIYAIVDAMGGCEIADNYILCSSVNCNYGVKANSLGVTISGNYIQLTVFYPPGSYGIVLPSGSGQRCIVSNNIVFDCYNAIISLGSSNDNTITGNHFESAASMSIQFGGMFSDNYVSGIISTFVAGPAISFSNCVFASSFTFVGTDSGFEACHFLVGAGLTGSASKMAVTNCYFGNVSSITNCLATGCEFHLPASGTASLSNSEATNCDFVGAGAIPETAKVVMVDSVLSGCRSSVFIMDHASTLSKFNYVFDTYCYAAVLASPPLYQGMFFSDRTYKLVVEGCDVANVGGDYSTLNGPRDVSVSSTRTDQIWMHTLAQVSIMDCKIGLRNTTMPNSLASRFDLTFQPWANASATLTGTVSVTNGNPSVTGTGTKFKAEVQVGDLLRLSAHADSVLGKVQSISSDTALTLSANYAGATASGSAVSGAARGTFIGNDIDEPSGSQLVVSAISTPDSVISFSGNRMTGQLEVSLPIINAGTYTSSLMMHGNHISGYGGVALDLKSYSSTTLSITGNHFASGVSITYDSGGGGLPAWGTTFFSGVFSNNTSHGAVDIRFTRGLTLTGNRIVCTPSNELLTFFRCMDVVIDGNYIFKTASNGFNRLIMFNDIRRVRLTNNILGSDWVSPDGTELLYFLGNSAGTIGYDLIIMGNHQYFVGASAPTPTQGSLIASATVWWMTDAAASQTSPSRLGGTVSNPASP